MPIRCTVSEHINASPETVFAAATDLATLPQRISGIKSLEVLTAGPIGKGTKYRETRIMFGKEAIATMEVVDFQPGTSCTTGSTDGGCDYRKTVFVRPAAGGGGGGGTELTYDFSGKPLTFFTKLMSPLISIMVKKVGAKALRKDLADLKAALERAPAGHAG
jgi:hypothetical protein